MTHVLQDDLPVPPSIRAATLVLLSLLGTGCDRQERSSANRACSSAWTALDQWRLAQAGYDTLLPRALAEGWSGRRFNEEVAQWIADHYAATGGHPADVDASPSTNMCRCDTSQLEELCDELRRDDRPQILCDAARAHEARHVEQCQANRALPDTDADKYPCDANDVAAIPLARRVAYEHEAYDASFAALRPWLEVNCTSRCDELASATSWTGSINLLYERTSESPFGSSTLEGSATYVTSVERPQFEVDVDGYTETWLGSARGAADFEYVVRDPSTDVISYTRTGNGALVDEPPLGQFNVEVLRIDPQLCFYALETSAVIEATDPDGKTPDGVALVLGDNMIEPGAAALSGTRTLPLPQPLFGGVQDTSLHLPGLPFELDASTETTGSFAVTWSFTPTQAD